MPITKQSTFEIDKLMTNCFVNCRPILQTVLTTATVVTFPVVRPAVGQPDVTQATRITVQRAPVTVSVNSPFSSNTIMSIRHKISWATQGSTHLLGYTRQHPPPGLHQAASQKTTGQQKNYYCLAQGQQLPS